MLLQLRLMVGWGALFGYMSTSVHLIVHLPLNDGVFLKSRIMISSFCV